MKYDKELIEAVKTNYIETSNQVKQLIAEGDEQAAAETILYYCSAYGEDITENNYNTPLKRFSSQKLLQSFYNSFTDKEILYDCIIGVYLYDGFCFPKRIIMKAKKIMNSIPDDVRYNGLCKSDSIVVYRGTKSDIDRLRFETSWSTDKDTAIHFAQHACNNEEDFSKAKVYRAEIKYNDIIAYITLRDEFEILQYNSVTNISQIEL